MKKIKVGFTDFWDGYVPENSYFLSILRKYYDVEIFDTRDPIAKREVEYLFCGVYSHNFLDFDCIRILYTGENVIPDFNLYDYAIGFEKMKLGDRYFQDPLCYTCIRHNPKLMSDIQVNRLAHQRDIESKKFCAMVVSNGSNADRFRTHFFNGLSKYKVVDSGGRYLNNIGGNMNVSANESDCYLQRKISNDDSRVIMKAESHNTRENDKIEFLKNYKFSFAIENVSHEGYCTEKIIESFAAGTIPIYWGDKKVTNYFNKKAFINCHDYSSIEEVIETVKEIDNDDEKYITMLKEPIFSDSHHAPAQQDIRFEKWFLSIFEKDYMIRRNRIGMMKNYEDIYRIRRDISKKMEVNEQEELRSQVKWTVKNCPYQENDRLVLYGAGKWGGIYYQWICENHWGEVVGWIDKCWYNKQQMGYPISPLDLLLKIPYDYVLVAIENKAIQDEVIMNLVNCGVSEKKILVI